jgi:general secretion pathway protein M
VNALRNALASAEQFFARLSAREKIFVSAFAGALTVCILALVAFGFSRAIHRRQESIEEKSKALSEIGSLASTYRERDARRRQLEERLRVPVKLFTYIDDLSKKQGIEIGDMQDRGTTTGADKISESVVEFDLSKLTLDKLTSFLNAIERGPHLVKVTKIRIRTRLDDPNAVDASLTVATYSVG